MSEGETEWEMQVHAVLKYLCEATGVSLPETVGIHIGVFQEPYLGYIYDGRKMLESRFTRNRIAPYGCISSGDVVLIKRAAGAVEAAFAVGEVRQYNLQQTPIAALRAAYGEALCVDEVFWQKKEKSRYAVLLEIQGLLRFSPFPVEKRGRSAWITLRRAAQVSMP